MRKIIILMGLVGSFFWANNYTEEQLANMTEEQLVALKTQALERAQAVMMQEIFNVTKDIRLNNNTREELIENLFCTQNLSSYCRWLIIFLFGIINHQLLFCLLP